MNSVVASYRRTLSHTLHCSLREKKQLLAQFDHMTIHLLDESEAPSREALTKAFGPPEELAKSMLETLPTEAQVKWKRQRRHRISFGIIVMILLFGFLIYEAAIRPMELTFQDTIVYIK